MPTCIYVVESFCSHVVVGTIRNLSFRLTDPSCLKLLPSVPLCLAFPANNRSLGKTGPRTHISLPDIHLFLYLNLAIHFSIKPIMSWWNSCPTMTPPSAEAVRHGPSAFDAANPPPTALLDYFFPGFSMLSSVLQRYLKIDLNIYLPLILLLGCLVAAWRYLSEYFWSQIEGYFMSSVDIRTDDEIYNMLMAWVAQQRFARGARRFVVNTDLNSRAWYVSWRWDANDDEDEEKDETSSSSFSGNGKKTLAYTPTFGSHYFFYKRRLCIFRRDRGRAHDSLLSVSEKEEITISCFGRNPNVLKELLLEARAHFVMRDQSKTLIYRGTTRPGSSEPLWQRAMARESRPFSTVILNEKKKQDLVEDVTDYLNPVTRRWYANRGIPYRRGYLLYGPPGTGKSSLSLALAGFFKMRIYIVSLSSITSTEENLATLFAELPRRCVVLLEDIDTAGLTHTREKDGAEDGEDKPKRSSEATKPDVSSFRLSLSGLLNILDGVASQEGRVLIMTTNHLENLDKALIRPGRVDNIVEFGLADSGMISSIFRAIFAPLEADASPSKLTRVNTTDLQNGDPAGVVARVEADKIEREKTIANVDRLAAEFAEKIPAHEFSPAELQGFLLKNKRNPEGAVAGAEAWVTETRNEKASKQLKEAEAKRKKQEEEEKRKEKEEKEKKEKGKKSSSKTKKRNSKKNQKISKNNDTSDDSSSDSASSSSGSDSEPEAEQKKKTKKSSSSKEEIKIKTEEVLQKKPQPVEPCSAITDKSDGFVKVEQTMVADGDSEQTRPGSAGQDSGYNTPE